MKNTREFFAECFRAEKPKFLRVLQAVPADQAGYRPHPKSNSAGGLVWLLASEWGDACELIDKSQVNYVARPAPAKLQESIAAFERNAGEIEKRLGKLDDAAWEKNAQFLMDGKVAWESPLGEMPPLAPAVAVIVWVSTAKLASIVWSATTLLNV